MFIRYVAAKVKEWTKEEAYRVYVTDALKAIASNTAPMAEEGTIMNFRFVDMVQTDRGNEEEKSGDEIAIEVIKNAGLKVVVSDGPV